MHAVLDHMNLATKIGRDHIFEKKSKIRLYMYQIDNLILEIENTHLKDVFETQS